MESKDGGSGSSQIMPLGFVVPGSVLGCDVIPTDSYAEGTTRSDTFTLLNSPPVASNLKVIPQRARAYRLDGENLIASYDYSDADGNPESGSVVSWYRNGAFFSNLIQVPASSTTIGQTWYFTVTPRDSSGTVGALATSETITIRGNAIPTTSPPTITPTLPRDDDDLVSTAAPVTDTDPGDETTNIFHWTKNGVSWTGLQMPFDTEVPLNPGTNGVTLDYSGNNNNGAVNGSTWVQAGVVGGAFSFDGSDYIRVPEVGNTLGGSGWTEMSVEFWAKTASTSQETVILMHDQVYSLGGYGGGTKGLGYRVDYRGSTTGYRVYWYIYNATAATSVNSQVNEGPGEWHHIVATYKSGVGMKLYTDGTLRVSAARTGAINTTVTSFLDIGGLGSGTGDFVGQMDEVRIYPTALSAAQVFQRYIDTKDGLSGTSTIVPQETTSGDIWRCQVTPNDSWADGTTTSLVAKTVTTGNTRPRIDWYSPADTTPNVIAGGSLDFKQVSSDPNSSPLTYSWTVNGGSSVASTQNYTQTFLTPGNLHSQSNRV
jgi:hypothetical protein